VQSHQDEEERLVPRVHRVIALLKRRLPGTHQGAIPLKGDSDSMPGKGDSDSMPGQLQRPDLPSAVYWFTALAFALRLAVRLCTGSTGFFVTGYSFLFEMAQSIATGFGISLADHVATAFRMPLYSMFLAAVTFGHEAFLPIVIAQSLVGAGTTFSAALLARQMFGGQLGTKAAILASGITAVYPYYVIHDTGLQDTSLYTLLTLLAVIVLQRVPRTGSLSIAALGGCILGLDVLTRSTIAPFAALACLWLAGRRRIADGLMCAVVVVLIVSPWVWRSYELTGVPTLSTESGMELWTGNNGFLFCCYPRESSDVSKEVAKNALTAQDRLELMRLIGNEANVDRWFLHRAVAYIRTHPWATVRDGVRKDVAAFGWLPSPSKNLGANLVHAFSYGPVMLLGLWGMARRRTRWRDDSLIYVLFGTFILVTAVFFGATSHRVFLDVYWIVFGAGALAGVIQPVREDKFAGKLVGLTGAN
jgi:hypothetical protein